MTLDLEWDDAAFILAHLPGSGRRAGRIRAQIVYYMRSYDGDTPGHPECVRPSPAIKKRVEHWRVQAQEVRR